MSSEDQGKANVDEKSGLYHTKRNHVENRDDKQNVGVSGLPQGKKEEQSIDADKNSFDSFDQASLRLPRTGSTSDTSPDISLSSQNTLRYSDVEASQTERERSLESSDSTEPLEEPVKMDSKSGLSTSFRQHLTLTPGIISGSSVESGGQISVGSCGASAESHEVVADVGNASRPESLSLSRSVSENKSAESDSVPADSKLADTGNQGGSHRRHEPKGSLSQRLQESDQYSSLSQGLPQGTITRKGDLIEFVASDLQEKIKQSSPLSQPDAASSGSRRSSIRSFASASSSTSFATSSGMSQSPSSLCQQSPEDIPPIDAAAVIELENHATRVADSLDLMMGNIRNNLHKMSAITIGCQDAYKRSVDITCDSVDASIKTMYALMAKCEELSASMGPVQQLAIQIREIKRILDLFESQLTDK